MNFEFATATRIVFGPGKRSELFAAALAFGQRAILVTGANAERASWIFQNVPSVAFHAIEIASEPTIDMVSDAARAAREFDAEFVIALGGGSVIDAGKAIAALATNLRPT